MTLFFGYNSVYDYLIPVAISALAWRGYYYAIGKFCPDKILPRSYNKYEQAKSQVCSITASLTTLTISGICHIPKIISCFPDLSALFGQELDDMAKLLHVILSGYFIHDTIWCVQNKYNDAGNYFHHFISLGMFLAGLHYNNCFYETIWPLWASEISTVPLNLRFFHKMYYGKNSQALDYSFAGLFFIGRVIGGSWCIWHFCKTPGPMWIRFIGVSAWFLNSYWFYKIMEKTSSSPEKKVQKKEE